MKNQSTSEKLEVTTIASKSPIIPIEVQVEELPQPRTVQDFLKSLQKGNDLAQKHSKYLERFGQIEAFSKLIEDGSACTMVITHTNSKNTIEFPHVAIIHDFIKSQIRKGSEEIGELESEMKIFSLIK
ncbi:hypothetical protein [Flectobacillus roseus]|uniref:hypothetical protein n=1 Tax=Flectobacillus roseus TaxID=502259 RepID=UPI0024B65A78|nr:hypothetical protein [Flectobacillus roseus]MDI9870575.1 hypothetical protein [Flectobacillus roseus]